MPSAPPPAPDPSPALPSPAQPGEVDRVYRQLREWLMDAVLPPGEFLSEPDLAQRCSTSRTPVREACMRLHQDRWLTRFPRKGFLVTPISVADIVDLYQFRKLLEGFAAGQVARTGTAGEIAELRGLLELADNPQGSAPAAVLANEAFHLRLAALAGNQRVLDQLGLVLAFCRRLDTLCIRADESWIPHHDLLEALERHDRAGAEQAMDAHLDHASRCLVKLFGNSPQRPF